MKTMKMCGRPDGTCCPEVNVHDDGNVDVTDKDQKVEFTPDQWAILRMQIIKGRI